MTKKLVYLMIFLIILVYPFLLGGCDNDPDKKCDECKKKTPRIRS